MLEILHTVHHGKERKFSLELVDSDFCLHKCRSGGLCVCVSFFFLLCFAFFVCFVLGLMNETSTVNVKDFIENVQMLLHKL